MMRVLCSTVCVVAACGFNNTAPDRTDLGPDAANPTNPTMDGALAGPWLHPWMKRKAITLHASQIVAPLADFPVAIVVQDLDIAAGALAAGGEDIVFTAADKTSLLASEIELFSKSTNELVAWVKVPSLSATTDTTIYVYYGRADPPARLPEAVWSAGYLGVWHLEDDPGPGNLGDIKDAAGDRDGTAEVQMATIDSMPAQLGRGIEFDGTTDYLDFGNLDVTNTFTISMWIRYRDHLNVNTLFANSGSNRETDGFRLFVNSANTTNRRLVFEAGNGTVGQIAETATNAVGLDVFTHVAAVVDRAAASARLYVNGRMAAVDTTIINDFRTASDFEMGRMENGFLYFEGILDEVQVSSTLRSADWIETSYNNQSRPDTFHTFASEEVRP